MEENSFKPPLKKKVHVHLRYNLFWDSFVGLEYLLMSILGDYTSII